MLAKKSTLFMLICMSVLLCTSFLGFFDTREVRAEVPPTEYTIQYLDTDDAHTPIITDNPASVLTADLPLVLNSPDETRAGYTFAGWGVNSGLLLPQNDNDQFMLTEDYLADYAVGSEIIIYANWELIEYILTIRYSGVEYGQVRDAAGFVEKNNKITVADEIDLTLTKFRPTCAGHEFLGWYTDPGFEHAITSITNITEPLNLYGKFNKIDLYITFADESLGLERIAFRSGIDRAYDYNGVEGLLTDLQPSKDGFTFDGWYTNEECTAEHKVGAFYIFTSPVILYAKWTPKPSPVWWYVFGGVAFLTIVGFGIWMLMSKKLKLN